MERFKIIGKIGEGAYSIVYTVKRLEDEKIYALKKVKIKNLSSKERTNALNEVRILASVKSSYIIGYKESFIDEVDQTLCIVMEYADDCDLFQKIKLYIKNETTFMDDDIWKIFIQITKGLSDLHEYHILHRDLKSANVFLFRDGTAKLGDLNVSKITSRGLGCTQTGTPYYASPEVWKDNPYDYKSDIWSLGCVFYELIMLKTPFRAKSMKDLYKKVMIGEYQPISQNFSPKFQIVIDRILKVKPEERPTAKEILEMPEILDKIEELNIFKNLNDINSGKKLINKNNITNINDLGGTAYNFSKKLTIKRNISEPIIDKNNKFMDEVLITKLSFKNNDKSNQNNKQNKQNKKPHNHIRFYPYKYPKNELINIYNHNINYLQKKLYDDKKFVIKTIKYPKKLSNLNDKLPEKRYDNENIIYKPLFKNILSNGILPKLNINNNILKNIKNINIKNNNNNFINNSCDNKTNENIIKNSCDIKMNTIKMQINQSKPFRYNGTIDIIVKE